jgi:hypothetical protein
MMDRNNVVKAFLSGVDPASVWEASPERLREENHRAGDEQGPLANVQLFSVRCHELR